tara:strand:+ start:620 stop:766 length:147 start_codon:yes stop_codon:yes gene_type:complete
MARVSQTTVRYWFKGEQFARHLSFGTYQAALNCIETFKLIDARAEVIV